MTREQQNILKLIEAHNETATFFETLPDIKIPIDAYMALMPISCKINKEGLLITRMANKQGLKCKIDMQSGYIHTGY